MHVVIEVFSHDRSHIPRYVITIRILVHPKPLRLQWIVYRITDVEDSRRKNKVSSVAVAVSHAAAGETGDSHSAFLDNATNNGKFIDLSKKKFQESNIVAHAQFLWLSNSSKKHLTCWWPTDSSATVQKKAVDKLFRLVLCNCKGEW